MEVGDLLFEVYANLLDDVLAFLNGLLLPQLFVIGVQIEPILMQVQVFFLW